MVGSRRSLRLLAATLLVVVVTFVICSSALAARIKVPPYLDVSYWPAERYSWVPSDPNNYTGSGTFSNPTALGITWEGYPKAQTLAIGYQYCNNDICADSIASSSVVSVTRYTVSYVDPLADTRPVTLRDADPTVETCSFAPEVVLLNSRGDVLARSLVAWDTGNSLSLEAHLAVKCVVQPAQTAPAARR